METPNTHPTFSPLESALAVIGLAACLYAVHWFLTVYTACCGRPF